MDIQLFKNYASQAIQTDAQNETNVLHVDNGSVQGQKWKTWGSRGSEFNESNKVARQEFINALKEQFHVQKLSSIPKVVLDELNLSDFDLDANDRVRSDKPLTARRVLRVTDATEKVQTLEQRTALFAKIAKSALTEKCQKEFVSLVKGGKLGTAQDVTDFVSRWFGGTIGEQLKSVMVASRQDRQALCEAVSEQLRQAVRQPLVSAGVTASDLKPMAEALRALSANSNGVGRTLWRDLAESVARKISEASNEISVASFDARLGMRQQKLDALRQSELEGCMPKLMKSEHGRDIIVRIATFGLERIGTLDAHHRNVLDRTLSFLAKNIKDIGTDRAYILVHNLRYMIGSEGTSVNRMQVRQVLGTILKQYTDLTDADLKQLPTTQLRDYALAAVDDSLVHDRATLTRTIHASAERFKAQNYTDAETQELMSFVREVEQAEPQAVAENQPVEQQPEVHPNDEAEMKKAKSLSENKVVCANLKLLGKLFHREDVWTNDALGGARAILDTLEHNQELVKTLTDNWFPGQNESIFGGKNMQLFSLGTVVALNALSKPDALNDGLLGKLMLLDTTTFAGSINKINVAIRDFSKATTQEAKLALCEKISAAVDDLTTGLTEKLQDMLTENLDAVLKGEGDGPFKGLPPGQQPKDADLLALAKSRHPAPNHETKTQRKQREVAILAEYGKLVLDPQAGGIGALIRSLASNYVAKLDVREKRSMLSGAFQSLSPETLTEILQGKSIFDLAALLKDGKLDEVKNIILKKGEDGKLTEPQKKAAGEIAGGILKGAGPVLQKMIQMIGAEKLPKFLQQAVKDCKSRLKPIPNAYVKAKLAEIVRQSNGKILSIDNQKSIGAASIAQAFECTVQYRDGTTRQVVVKMLRPDVRGRMEREIAAIRASVAEAGEGALRTLNARINSLLAELDFSEERANIESCQSIYGNSSFKTLHSVKLAEGCPQLPDVLIMEKAPGTTAQDYMDQTTKHLNEILDGRIKTDANGHYTFSVVTPEDHVRIKRDLLQMYDDVRKRQANLQRLMQTWFSNAVFGNGQFHGDLHGGNIMVDDNGDMTFIDFGNAPTFSPAERKQVVGLIVSALRGKSDAVLDAAMKLVSAGSQQALTAARESLRAKLDAMFALGDVRNGAEERLKAVFGELSRAGVEIPSSLYNFIEAFGRIQQLSSSMEATLQRISTALPYMRQYLPGGELRPTNPTESSKTVITLDRQIDFVIQRNIDTLRKDHPGISESEIFQLLKYSADNGELNNLFDAYDGKNPVAGYLMPLCGKIVSNEFAFTSLTRKYGNDFGKLIPTPADYQNGNLPKIKKYSDTIIESIHENINVVLGPYCEGNEKFAGAVGELKDLISEAYGVDKMEPTDTILTLLRFRMELQDLHEASSSGGKSISKEAWLAKLQGRNLTEEQANTIADLNSRVQTLLFTKILPGLTEIYKARMAEVMSGFDLSQFPPPVKMSDSIKSSVCWHIPSAIGLGGTNALGLGASILWNKLTDKTVEIRANFKVKLAPFRSFAEKDRGRLRATKSKQLEVTTSMNTLSVHNAEAWRAFVEALSADLHVEEAAFYKTAAGRKVMAILNLGQGETLNDVEQASPLTPALVRSVLAARDMDGLDRTSSSLAAITTYFSPGSAIENLSFERFFEKLDEAFQNQFGQTMAQKLDLEVPPIKALFASHYGEVITRMSEIGASDPYYAQTGKAPRPEDVQRWFIAAFIDVLVSRSEEFGDEDAARLKENLTLDKVFGEEKMADVRQQLAAAGLRNAADVRTAVLLHAKDDEPTLTGLLQFLQETAKGNPAFRQVPDEMVMLEEEARRTVLKPAEIVREIDPESKAGKIVASAQATMLACVGKLGYRVWAVAADDGLYQRFKAAAKPVGGDLLEEIQSRVRREIYAGNVRPPLDLEVETSRIIMYWTAKDLYENPPVEQNPEPEPEQAEQNDAPNFISNVGTGIKSLFGFFGSLMDDDNDDE